MKFLDENGVRQIITWFKQTINNLRLEWAPIDHSHNLSDILTSDEAMAAFFARARELGLITTEEVEVYSGLVKIADFSSNWLFTKNAALEGEMVSLPHTYNATEGMVNKYFRGETIYNKAFTVPDYDTNSNYWIWIGAAGTQSVIYLDGTEIRSHQGGYVPFAASLGKLSAGDHTITITCDNSYSNDVIPLSADFNFDNGLYRKIYLVSIPEAGFDIDAYGIDRMHVVQNSVNSGVANLTLKTRIESAQDEDQNLSLTIKIIAPTNVISYSNTENITVSSSGLKYTKDIQLLNPVLWQGKTNPYLYTVSLELSNETKIIDTATIKTGFRNIEFDSDNNRLIRLNGTITKLRGVCMHQDDPIHQAAATNADIDRDFEFVLDLGCNYLRLAHYPHAKHSFDLCDQFGIAVQTEIPWVNHCGNNSSEAYHQCIIDNMAEMVKNYFNHPSIFFLGYE